jgi:hypothetical protein
MLTLFLLFLLLLLWVGCFCDIVVNDGQDNDDIVSDCESNSVEFAPILIFSSLKATDPDDADTAVVRQAQRNAVFSWKNIRPQCHVVLFGNERGTSQLAAELQVTHVVDVPRGPGNLPLVNELFARAESLAAKLVGVKVLLYVNADIVLTDELPRAVLRALAERGTRPLLLMGKRYNSVNFRTRDLATVDGSWQALVRGAASAVPRDYNHNNNRWAIDYFAFTPGAFGALPTSVPPFSLGIAVFDNWLVHSLIAHKAFVVDASLVVPAVHQSHPISPMTPEKQALKDRNTQLAKQWYYGRIDAARWYMTFCDIDADIHFTYGDAVPERMCLHEREFTL